MTHPSEKKTSPVIIPRHRWDSPIRVRREAFVDFSSRIDQGLRELVACWQPDERSPSRWWGESR